MTAWLLVLPLLLGPSSTPAASRVAARQDPLPMPAASRVAARQDPLPMPAASRVAATQDPLPMPAASRVAARQDPLPMEVRVPRMDTSEAQLAHARGLKRSMLGRPEAEREFWRRMALDAYLAVPHYHPGDRVLGAEALFRAGELARAAGNDAEALELFARVRALGGDTPFHARAGLEVGHVHRRNGRSREALDAYLPVAGDARAHPSHRDEAWLWAGKVWSSMGRKDEARRAWKGVASGAEDPVDRVLAYDYLALLWVEEGDLEAAAGVLDECLRALADVALEETERGASLRKALQRMRVVDVLREQVRRRVEHDAEDEQRAPALREATRGEPRSSRGTPMGAPVRDHDRPRSP